MELLGGRDIPEVGNQNKKSLTQKYFKTVIKTKKGIFYVYSLLKKLL